MLKARLSVKGLSGLLSQGKEKKGRENESNGKAQPVRATHFDYITKPSSSGSYAEQPRGVKPNQPHGQNYSRGRSERPRDDRKHRHSTGSYNHSSTASNNHSSSKSYRSSSSGSYSRPASGSYGQPPSGSYNQHSTRSYNQSSSGSYNHPSSRSYNHSSGSYKNGSSAVHLSRPEGQRRYSREDDEELLLINYQRDKADDRSQRRRGSLPRSRSPERGQGRGGSLPGYYRQPSTGSPQGPPKPPRRQQSLNRIHIPDGPDTDVTSPSDYDVYSPSSESSSPKNWKVSPLSPRSQTTTYGHGRSWSPSKEYSQPSRSEHRSPDRKHPHYENKQYTHTDQYYSQREKEREGNDQQYSGNSQTFTNGNSREDTTSFLTKKYDGAHSQQSYMSNQYADRYPQYPSERSSSRYQFPSTHQYNDTWHNEHQPNQFSQSWDTGLPQNLPQTQSQSASTARPLVLPQNGSVSQGPRPIYRSDGEIDLREPSYHQTQESELFTSRKYSQKPTDPQYAKDFSFYNRKLSEDAMNPDWWDGSKQEVDQTQFVHSNSLRTVRGVKAYDQHVKKFKRPTSLGGIPRGLEEAYMKLKSSTGTAYQASAGYSPSLECSDNSAFGVAHAHHQQSYGDFTYQKSAGSYNSGEFDPSDPYLSSAPVQSDSTTRPEILPNAYQRSGSTQDNGKKGYQTNRTVRSPIPSDQAHNAVKSQNQRDSGKQTIFCLVSQVVPTSPSPEASPGPIQRERVAIEEGKVSPVMAQPIDLAQASYRHAKQSATKKSHTHGSYSPVRSQLDYHARQTDKDGYQPMRQQERRPFRHSVSQDSSTGNESDMMSSNQQHGLHSVRNQHSVVSKQTVKGAQQKWDYKQDVRGASVSSGYHSSPEYDGKNNEERHLSTRSTYEKQRFSDAEYRTDSVEQQGEVDTAPIVPVKDLIKKINRKAVLQESGDQDVPRNRLLGDESREQIGALSAPKQHDYRDSSVFGENIVLKRLVSEKGDHVVATTSKNSTPKEATEDQSAQDVYASRYAIDAQDRMLNGTGESHQPDYLDTRVFGEDIKLRKVGSNREKSPSRVFYNAQYMAAPASQGSLALSSTKMKSEERSLSHEAPFTSEMYQPVESTPEQDDDSDEKPINARNRRAYYESLKPLSREEEIQNVTVSKTKQQNHGKMGGTPTDSKKLITVTQSKVYHGSIKWPNNPTEVRQVSGNRVEETVVKSSKTHEDESVAPPRVQKEVTHAAPLFIPSERQAFYERLKQSADNNRPSMMGRRSQSLPRLNVNTDESSSAGYRPHRKSIEELMDPEVDRTRLSVGAQLFYQKKQEVEQHYRKKELLQLVKGELRRRRYGSEPDLANDREEEDVLDTLEDKTHFLMTHIAGKRIRGRDSADFEFALSQLQDIHTEADQGADEILYPQFYQPYDHRAAEIPLREQKVADLQTMVGVHAEAGSVKQRRKVKRSRSDVSETKSGEPSDGQLPEQPGTAKKNQDFFPYRQASHPKKMVKHKGLGGEGGHESTSDEEKTPRPLPSGTNPKLYRPPKSSDNLGYSSDSSPERPMKVKTKITITGKDQSKSGSRGSSYSSAGPNSGQTGRPGHPLSLPPPIKQSVKFTEVPKVKKAVVTKPPPAPGLTKFKETQLHLQPPGSRDSVSTIDSAMLAQPFEDMHEEYRDMMMEHAAADLLPPKERTSSSESLLKMVAASTTHWATPATVDPDASYCPSATIPLADEEEDVYSSDGAYADLEDLEVPDPSELKWETPLSHRSLSGEGALHEETSPQERYISPRHSPVITSEAQSHHFFGDQRPDATMSTRGNRSVAKLQEKYGSERPLSFDSSHDRRSAYASSASRSLKSLDSEPVSSLQARYSQDRGTTHSKRSSGDFPSSRPLTDSYSYSVSSTVPDMKHSTHLSGMSHLRPGSASSDSRPVGRQRGFQDDHRGKLTGDIKRGSTESGYGSLEREKIRQGNYAGAPGADSNPVNAIRDKYLTNRPLSSSNGESSRTGPYSTKPHEMRAIANPPTSVSDGLARALHSGSESEDSESRAARIARYKEQRRRELAEKYGLGPSSSESDSATRRKYSTKEELSPTSERLRKLSNASDRSTGLDASLLPRRYPSRESLSSITGEVESVHTNGNTSQDTSPSTTPRLSRKARRDSNISQETQEFIDALEASRAARRERLRRSETEETSDAADRLIARHRRRKSSVDSSSDVFDSPGRSASRGRHDDFSDSDSVTSSTSIDRPSRHSIKSDRSGAREAKRNSDTKSKAPEPPVRSLSESSANNSKQTRDKRKRHNQTITVEDIHKASQLKTSSEPTTSATKSEPQESKKSTTVSQKPTPSPRGIPSSPKPAPRIIKPPGETEKESPQESSPRTLKPGNFKIETVTKTEIPSEASSPKKLGEQSITAKRAPSPSKDTGRRESGGSEKKLEKKNTLSPATAKHLSSSDSELDGASKVRLKKPEIPKVLQDATQQRKNSNSSESSVSPTRKVRGGSFSQQSTDSEKSGSIERPKSMPLKNITRVSSKTSQVKAKGATDKTAGDKGAPSSPEKKKVTKTSSSPERKGHKKSGLLSSPERKMSSGSSSSASSKAGQLDKRSSYPPSKTASPDRKPLSRRQSSPEKKLTRPPSPEKKVTKISSTSSSSSSSSEKKLGRQSSVEKKTTRMSSSPEKKATRTTSPEKSVKRTTSPEKRLSKSLSTEKKEGRQSSPEKRPSVKRTTSPAKKSSSMKDAEKKPPNGTVAGKTQKEADNKKKSEAKTNGVLKEKTSKTAKKKDEDPAPVKEEIILTKVDAVRESRPPLPEQPPPLLPEQPPPLLPEQPPPTVTVSRVPPTPDRKPSHAKRLRSKTIEVESPQRFGQADPKREALATKDEDLLAMMQLRAQQIKEEEMKEGKASEEEEEEELSSVSEERPADVIKVSLKDRMQSFKAKEAESAAMPQPKQTPKKTPKFEVITDRKKTPPPKVESSEETKESEEETDQLASLSLSEKMKMFTQISAARKKAAEEEASRIKSRPQRFHRTRGRERYQTQPVTPEELTSASSLARDMAAQAEQEQKEAEEKKSEEAEEKKDEDIPREIKREEIEEPMDTQERIRMEIRNEMLKEKVKEEESAESDDSRLPSMAEEEEQPPDVQEDEYSKLSLSEKMRLFKEKSTSPTVPPPKVEPPKRKRRSESRFKTQPITVEEVKKAAVSPLAKSFSRPPSMEILGALPLAGQISLVYGDTSTSAPPPKASEKDIAEARRCSTSNVPEPSPEKPVPKVVESSAKPQSYKESVKKQKNLAALIASEIKETSQTVDGEQDEDASHPTCEAVDESIKMARLGLEMSSPVGEETSVQGTSPTDETKKTSSLPEKKVTSPQSSPIPQKRTVSPKKQSKVSKGKEPSPTSSPERKPSKPQPHPRSPQKIRRNNGASTSSQLTKDASPTSSGKAPSSPAPPPRRSKMGSLASMRREDSRDGDISSGGEDGRRMKNGTAAPSSSEQATPQRDNKADQIMEDGSSSESEPEVRARVSPVTDEHVAIIKKKQAQRNGAEKRDRNKTQPISIAVDDQSLSTPKKQSTSRSLRAQDPDRFKTQPVTPDELAQVRLMMEPVKTAASIQDRLFALKKSGEEDWKKRISKYEDSPKSGLKERLNQLNHNSKFQKNNEEDDVIPGNQSSISQRLQLLQENETTWKKRVEEKDVDRFTVTGKLKQAGKVTADEAETKPQTHLRRSGSNRKPRAGSVRITIKRTDSDGSLKSDDPSTKQENGTDTTGSGLTTTTTESEDSEPDFRVIKTTVKVMKPDDEGFTDFFASSSTVAEESVTVSSTPMTSQTRSVKKAEKTKETLKVNVSDFDALTEGTGSSLGMIASHRRSLRPARRTRPSTNPLRAMKTRPNIVSEYTEERIELAEVETKKSKSEAQKEKASRTARAGLASKEDIAQGKTKLTTVKDVREMGGSLSELLPYKDLMLIQVKGRRFVQVRLVEPKITSLNSGDCFILVMPNEIYLWIGEYANVIEKSKASEIAQHIQQKRDLGCKAPTVIEIQESKQKTSHARSWQKFAEWLGGEAKYRDVGAPDEDELHEIYVTETNMVYKVVGDSLEPYEAYWASPGKYKMLDTNEVFVFDFGSEIYVWRGKSASKKKRKAAAQLAQLLWERGYDYSEYDVNPILPHDSKTMVGHERPEWTLIGKATQHMETVLFRHKFIDWPRETVASKNEQDEQQKNEQAPELVPFDAKLMIQPSKEKPHLILEGTNLGRGDAFFNKVDRKGQKINTLSVVVWHVLEFEHSMVPEESFGQFHEGDTYVIRWVYNVENTGMRDLKGNVSKWGGSQGRERCAYFFWQGQQSTINEKGASALMTVELDEERGPQKQVVQGKEPAAFLQLFRGRMVVHVGKREDEETNTQGSTRLYYVRGEHTKETSLVEVPCKMRSLRSRTSFLLVNLENVQKKKASIHLWHGAKVSKASRECAKHAAEAMKENKPLEVGLTSECSVTLEEMDEGKETAFFSKTLGKDRKSYDSAISDPLKYDYTPRLFHLTSASGVFVSNEILYPSRSEELPSPYPFLQSDLYLGEQPSLFALDNHYEIYLWQGWWPADHESPSGTTKTGSAKIRWDIDRKLAMETIMAYCKEKRPKNPPKAYLVYAGLEPLTFTNLFPAWEVQEEVMKINKESGKKSGKAILVKDILAKLTQAQFTMEELSKRPLPEGVDPMKLETYLSKEEFKLVLKMTKEEFYKLPAWKQKNLKKTNGLF